MSVDVCQVAVDLEFSDDEACTTELDDQPHFERCRPSVKQRSQRGKLQNGLVAMSLESASGAPPAIPSFAQSRTEGERFYEHAQRGDVEGMRAVVAAAGGAPTPPPAFCNARNEKDSGKTPLMAACLGLHVDAVAYLLGLASKQSVLAEDTVQKRNALHCAVGALLDSEEAVAENDDDITEVVELLVQSRCATVDLIAAQDLFGRTPLHIAIVARQVRTVSVLLQVRFKLAPLTLRLQTNSGDTPLHLAARSHLAKALIEHIILRASHADFPDIPLPVWKRLFRTKQDDALLPMASAPRPRTPLVPPKPGFKPKCLPNDILSEPTPSDDPNAPDQTATPLTTPAQPLLGGALRRTGELEPTSSASEEETERQPAIGCTSPKTRSPETAPMRGGENGQSLPIQLTAQSTRDKEKGQQQPQAAQETLQPESACVQQLNPPSDRKTQKSGSTPAQAQEAGHQKQPKGEEAEEEASADDSACNNSSMNVPAKKRWVAHLPTLFTRRASVENAQEPPPAESDEEEDQSKHWLWEKIGDATMSPLCIANAAGEPPLNRQAARDLLLTTVHRKVALELLEGMNTLTSVTADGTRPPVAPFSFDIETDDVDMILEREGTTWIDVLDLMTTKSHVSYSRGAVITAVGGLLVLGDELSDYLVSAQLFFQGKPYWALASFGVLLAAQLVLLALLRGMERSPKYRHAFRWVPSSRMRLVPFLFDGTVFFRAAQELWSVTNLSKAKSLQGFCIALAFLEALTESLPQAVLQFSLFRYTDRGDDASPLLLYVSLLLSFLSIAKAVGTYIQFKCSNRTNILGIIRPVDASSTTAPPAK
ncbi:hypothetical protein DIPPA_03352 [Diplonema papillatum]|nr:hypothetical protein DIPPA_03352 [Diplonema papillatum]|eukprot:gene3234-5063_t